jgi:hypothetical protein
MNKPEYIDLDVREKLKEHYSQVNSYLDRYEMNKKTRRFMFSNESIFNFISHPHLSKPGDLKHVDRGVEQKGIKKAAYEDKEYIKFPEFNESYLNYEIQNLLKETDIEFDPFYFIWQKQIELYYEELKELTKVYFEGVSSDEIQKLRLHPIDIFVYYNKKVVKLERRSKLIFALMGNNPSIVQLGKENKRVIYNTLRCNWIDDNGDIDRNVRIQLGEIGEINVHKDAQKRVLSITAPDFNLSKCKEILYKVLKSEGWFTLLEKSERDNNAIILEYAIIVNNEEFKLDFSKPHLTISRVLSLLEYSELSGIFKKYYT